MSRLRAIIPEETPEARRATRDEAFLVYATEAGRSVRTTRAILRDRGLDVPEGTLAYWKRVDQWDQQADAILLAEAGARLRRIATHLLLAAEQAALWLERANRGLVAAEKDRLAAAKTALASLALIREGGYLDALQGSAVVSDDQRERVRERFALLSDELHALPPGTTASASDTDTGAPDSDWEDDA